MTEETELPPGMAVLWQREATRPRPGRRPRLTLDGIAEAAIGLADADGIDAVSMARVAERLGVTTMALYRYVANKDELLALMFDIALAPSELGGDAAALWRERLEAWCRAQLALVEQHPWTVRLTMAPVGPGRLRWLELGLDALSGTRLPDDVAVGVIGQLSLYIFTEGELVAAIAEQESGRQSGPLHPALVDYSSALRGVVDPEQHPRVAAALASGAFDDTGADDTQEQQDLALGILLDGVEALVRRYDG